MQHTPVFIYLTVPTNIIGEAIAQRLLSLKLVACVNFFPITSMYHWQGTIACDAELVMILKTFDHLSDQIEAEILLLHPYQVPCITKIPVMPNQAFTAWMNREIST